MHIPDGYLSPITCGTMYAAAAPFWYIASRKLQRASAARAIPLMALTSAFCFVVQMLNIPLPFGTTGHAVGAALAAILLQPWAAVLSVSVALVIQALFFGDGGLTTIGANCFNMAIVHVFVSYYIYSICSGLTSRPVAAGIAGYIGLNVAALFAGIELGLQPMIARGSDGTPLYAPYPLNIAVPAMLGGHLIAGFAEAALAATAVAYLERSGSGLLSGTMTTPATLSPFWNRLRALWIVVGVLIILTPLGLLAPGTAWGEWSAEQLRTRGLGFVPQGVQKWEGFWHAIFADYSIPGFGQRTGYILSALCGVLLIIFVFAILTWLGRRTQKASVK